MILNIITPHLGYLLYKIYFDCKKCCDTGCDGDKKTKTQTKQEYFKLHIGPDFMVEGRYAQISTTLFVALMYSSGMPILYLCIFFFLLLTYWIDKILFLRYYRIPPQFDNFISNIFLNTVLFAILVHTLFGIWIYGNPYFLVDSSSSSSLDVVGQYLRKFIDIKSGSYAAEIVSRLTTRHNGLMICLALLILLVIILKISIGDLIAYLFFCGKEEHGDSLDEKDNVEIGTGK
jgi:hypothetical protein